MAWWLHERLSRSTCSPLLSCPCVRTGLLVPPLRLCLLYFGGIPVPCFFVEGWKVGGGSCAGPKNTHTGFFCALWWCVGRGLLVV